MQSRAPDRMTKALTVAAVAVGLLIVFGLFFMPLFKVASMSVMSEEGLSLAPMLGALTDPSMHRVIRNTLHIGVLSSLFAAIIGVAMAYVMAYTDIRGKKLIHILLLLPLVIPGYIMTLAWMQFLAKNGGVALMLRQWIPSFQMPDIYSYAGIIFVFAVTKYPVVYMLTLSTFRKITPDMELAALVSGCGRVGAFFKVTLPMSLSGVANGVLLVFLACLDNFGTVAFLGIPARITVLSTDIYQSVVSFSGNSFGAAAVKSVVLAVIGILASVILWRTAKLFPTAQTEMEDRSPRIHLGRRKCLVEPAAWLLIIGANLIPLVTMALTAFVKGLGVGFHLSVMSLDNFRQILENPKSMNAIRNSVVLGFSTCLICLIVGTAVAYCLVRRPSRGIRAVDFLISTTYSVPGIILGLGLILTWAAPLPLINKTIYNTLFMLLIAYVARFASLQVRSGAAAVLQLDKSMEEAASVSGAGMVKKWARIILPLILPATAGGLQLVFISALTELTTSSLLWSAGSEVIGVVVYNFTSAGYTTTACAMSTLTLLMLAVLFGGLAAAGKLIETLIKKHSCKP